MSACKFTRRYQVDSISVRISGSLGCFVDIYVTCRSDAGGSQDDTGIRAARGGRTASPPLRVSGAVRKARIQPSKGGGGDGGSGGAAKRAARSASSAADRALALQDHRSHADGEEEPYGEAALANAAQDDAAMAEAEPKATPEAAAATAAQAAAAKQARDDKRVYEKAVRNVRAGPAHHRLNASASVLC